MDEVSAEDLPRNEAIAAVTAVRHGPDRLPETSIEPVQPGSIGDSLGAASCSEAVGEVLPLPRGG